MQVIQVQVNLAEILQKRERLINEIFIMFQKQGNLNPVEAISVCCAALAGIIHNNPNDVSADAVHQIFGKIHELAPKLFSRSLISIPNGTIIKPR